VASTSGDGSHVLATVDPSLCPVLSGSSASAASRLRPADPHWVQRPESSFASGTRRPLSSHRARSELTDPAATACSGRRLSPGAQAVSTPIVTTPDTRAVIVPLRRDQFCAIRVSSSWLTLPHRLLLVTVTPQFQTCATSVLASGPLDPGRPFPSVPGAPRATASRHRSAAAFVPSRARARQSALHRTTESTRSRSRPRPAPPPQGLQALANK
jgi:hypothetical protein